MQNKICKIKYAKLIRKIKYAKLIRKIKYAKLIRKIKYAKSIRKINNKITNCLERFSIEYRKTKTN